MDDILEAQKEFDKSKGWYWGDPESEDERLENLEFAAIALAGEVGEFANEVKKASREDKSLDLGLKDQRLENIREELIDVFIYTLKASIALDMDLKKEYYKKLEKNKKKFVRFEKDDRND